MRPWQWRRRFASGIGNYYCWDLCWDCVGGYRRIVVVGGTVVVVALY